MKKSLNKAVWEVVHTFENYGSLVNITKAFYTREAARDYARMLKNVTLNKDSVKIYKTSVIEGEEGNMVKLMKKVR